MSGSNRKAESPSLRGARRSIVVSLGATTVALLLATPAAAAQPQRQACLGEDIRMYAAGGAGFGAFVAEMATATEGVGAEIQAHLAGAIPDDIQPNSCND